jgi:hypothetical protein
VQNDLGPASGVVDGLRGERATGAGGVLPGARLERRRDLSVRGTRAWPDGRDGHGIAIHPEHPLPTAPECGRMGSTAHSRALEAPDNRAATRVRRGSAARGDVVVSAAGALMLPIRFMVGSGRIAPPKCPQRATRHLHSRSTP